MENEEAVEPQEDISSEIEEVQEQVEQEHVEEEPKKTMVPLSVAQKLREQKRELELQLQWERQRSSNAPQPKEEDDETKYETATREDLGRSQQETVRILEERLWVKQNPEKFEIINQNLENFLKQRPNLASAINQASNRYEEAYLLMDALSPKEKKQLAKPPIPKKEAPNAPGSVPRSAALNDAVDVMAMSDTEFAEWRKSKRRVR